MTPLCRFRALVAELPGNDQLERISVSKTGGVATEPDRGSHETRRSSYAAQCSRNNLRGLCRHGPRHPAWEGPVTSPIGRVPAIGGGNYQSKRVIFLFIAVDHVSG